MKLFAPIYYKKFKCIADKCIHGCCSKWEIDIDDKTLKRYQALNNSYSDKIKASLEYDSNLVAHFRLCPNGKCPHLTNSGLCSIIINCGEDYLCDICREHPRFYNIVGNVAEVGLGVSCEEACRLILECEDYRTMQYIGDTQDCIPTSPVFNTIAERDKIYSLLNNNTIDYNERLSSLYNLYKISPSMLDDYQWHSLIDTLEYLDNSHKTLFCCYTSSADCPLDCQKYAERYLAYLIYRHTSSALTEEDFLCALGFCFFCERLLSSILNKSNCNSADIAELVRIISEEIEYSDLNTDNIISEFEWFI